MPKSNQPKVCAQCGATFLKFYSVKVWEKTVTCSHACGAQMTHTKNRDEAFEEKYIPEPNSGCWLWFGSANKYGYGEIWNGDRTIRASHFSYTRDKGPVPDGLCALHQCDNPYCVNPDHLFLGTHQDNMADMIKKRRHSHAERHRVARLTTIQVAEIRTSWKRSRDLSRELGICESHISHIRSGKARKLG